MLYPKEELGKTPMSWNHKPIVVYHPEMNGQGISACDPSVITTRKVGVMMNTKFEKGKLKSEAWIEVDRANKVDDRIMAAIEANQMMELSTGVFVDMEKEGGEWKGETYNAIARNYRPDHLALLPDKVGACSIKDGAGFLRNAGTGPTAKTVTRTDMMKAMKKAMDEAMTSAMDSMGLTDNALSFSNIRDGLCEAVRKKLNVSDNGPFCYVEDVYNDFLIYSLDGKLFRVSYTATDTGVTLVAEPPVPVVRVTEYRTVEGAFVGNQSQNQNQKQTHMNKKELVDGIITSNVGWTEGDRESLMDLTENQLTAFATLHKEMPTVNFTMERKDGKVSLGLKSTPAPVAAAAKPAAKPTPAPVVVDTVPKVVTLAEYIAAAPAEIQAVMNNSLSVYEEEKNKLVETIVANKNNPFTKEDLANRPLGELRGLARLAGVSVAPRAMNYSGQAPVPTDNAATEEAFEMPAMSFAKS